MATKNKNEWIETAKQLPPMGEVIECSEDMINIDTSMEYTDHRHCIMAGIAGGFGYFGEGFATNGENGCDKGLICDSPKYWRLVN